jgi:hypothetical protein
MTRHLASWRISQSNYWWQAYHRPQLFKEVFCQLDSNIPVLLNTAFLKIKHKTNLLWIYMDLLD